MRYTKPKCTARKFKISYFLTESNLFDALGFRAVGVVEAQSGSCDCGTTPNCNNAPGCLGSCNCNCETQGGEGVDTGSVTGGTESEAGTETGSDCSGGCSGGTTGGSSADVGVGGGGCDAGSNTSNDGGVGGCAVGEGSSVAGA